MIIDWSKSMEIVGEDAMLAAVQQNGYALQYCHQPSEEVMLAAVQQNGYALRYCHQPSEAVMLAAVQQNGYALQYCHQPSEAVMLAAVQQDGNALQYCHQPSEAVMLAAVQQDGNALQYCHQPSEAVMLAAVQQDGYALRYFKRAWVNGYPTLRDREIAAQIAAEIETWKNAKSRLENFGCRIMSPCFFGVTASVCKLLGAQKISDSAYMMEGAITLHIDPSEATNA